MNNNKEKFKDNKTYAKCLSLEKKKTECKDELIVTQKQNSKIQVQLIEALMNKEADKKSDLYLA